MEKFEKLLNELNELKIIQQSIDWAECLPENIWREHFENKFKQLASNLDPDTHRWYETSVSVVGIYDRILGIRHITNLFSESSSCEDCYVTIKFFEMQEVTIKSYAKK